MRLRQTWRQTTPSVNRCGHDHLTWNFPIKVTVPA